MDWGVVVIADVQDLLGGRTRGGCDILFLLVV
jgi:hypothetical protein